MQINVLYSRSYEIIFLHMVMLTSLLSANSIKMMKLDRTKVDDLKCSDYNDRLELSVSFFIDNNETNFSNVVVDKERPLLVYQYEPCLPSNSTSAYDDDKCDRLNYLAELTLANTSKLKIIYNPYFSYKFSIAIVSQQFSSSNSSRLGEFLLKQICHDDRDHEPYVKFSSCNEYSLDVRSTRRSGDTSAANNCTLTLTRAYSYNFLIKYVYLAIACLLLIILVFNVIRLSFFRYQILK
jgi:hypothetical protein